MNIEYLIFFITSLVISFLIANPIILLLKLSNAKQIVREDGPQDHLTKKSSTTTVGGIIFLLPVFLITLLAYFIKKDFQSLDLIIVLSTTFLMALVGFIDDCLKVLKKQNKGISGWVKLFIQFLVSLLIFSIYKEEAGLIFLIWVFFIIAGATNSYNLTDGLDGLVTSVSIVGFLGFAILFNTFGKTELVSFSIIFLGALLGFLYFNKYPAKVFMGDTGSLAIGGAIGSLAVVSKHELYLVFFATIPILEALSVILQVMSCQLSKKFLKVDKRIFKMTPLHHHFELCGWKETDIVKRFFLFQLVCTIVGIIILKQFY